MPYTVKNHRDPYPPLLVDGQGIMDDHGKAYEFNKYFDSVFTDNEDVSNINFSSNLAILLLGSRN